VEYSLDGNEVCIIPNFMMPFDHLIAISRMYADLGYTIWLPSDERRGYIFSKLKLNENTQVTA
jgi:hypothetical protein